MVDAVLHESSVVDNLDTQAERMEQMEDSDDLHTVGGSHCPLEPCGLLARYQIPCELEDP